MGGIRTIYRWAAALALLHAVALGAGVAYLMGTGLVDAQRLRDAFTLLRGQDADDGDADAGSGTADGDAAKSAAGVSLSQEDQRVAEEKAWRSGERYRTQLDQRLKFINAARLEVDRRREDLERVRAKDRKERAARAERESVAGYAKQVEILAALAPKAALSQVMSMSDADAAQVLFRLDTRKTKKIIEAAKTEAQKTKMITLLRLIGDVKPDPNAPNTNEAS